MGVFSRFKDIVSSNLNAMLDRAEDPEKMVRLMIREMEETLVELKADCAGTMAECRKLERENATLTNAVERWAQRAELAIDKGREDLAREALLEKHREEEKQQGLQREMAGCEGLIIQAQEDIRTLEEKLTAAKEKQGLLIQRHTHATARRQARLNSKRADGYEATKRFEEIEQQVERLEAAAEVENIRSASLENRFAQLEDTDKIEEELAVLKARKKD